MRADGGGKVRALAQVVQGRSRVARTLRGFSQNAERFGVAAVREIEVNGEPGAVAVDAEDRLIAVIAVGVAGGEIQSISSIVNPDKLQHLGPLAQQIPARRPR
jgi:hypothetical protein